MSRRQRCSDGHDCLGHDRDRVSGPACADSFDAEERVELGAREAPSGYADYELVDCYGSRAQSGQVIRMLVSPSHAPVHFTTRESG
jgi:hypothetical protein